MCAIALAGALDSIFTWISLEHFGTMGELNPLIQQFHRIGILPLWPFMTVVMSLLGGSILVSICFLFTGSTRDIAATAFGLLLGIRIGTLTVSVSNCYKIPFLGSGGMLLGVATFLLVRGYLSSGRGVSPDAIFRNI